MSQRRSVRKQVAESLQAIDIITGAALGRVGNLSADGLMLISSRALPDRHVYQVRFPLSAGAAGVDRVELGIQCLWSAPASGEHSHWNGCQIISASPADQERLDLWVEQAAEGG